jgi:sugar O-acyltransferase (sialic acid O-acetyltransferase NeuD family)
MPASGRTDIVGTVRVAIYGSRPDGHAKVLAELLADAPDLSIVGLIDDFAANADRVVRGLTVLGGINALSSLRGEGIEGVIVGFGESKGRIRVVDEVRRASLALPVFVHSSATVIGSARCEPGAQVLARAYVGPDAVIGEGALVNTAAIVEHDVELGRGSVVGPGSVITGRVRIGNEATIGAGATVLPDRRIGARAMVGAGAVVAHDVDEGTVVAGVPARPLAREPAQQ